MKEFRLFDIYDFLMDDDFIRWVQEGKEKDNEFWNKWLAQHPDKHLTIVEARRILQTLAPHKSTVNDQEKEVEVEKMLRTIGGQAVDKPKPPVLLISLRKKWWFAAAAVFVGAIGFAIYFLQRQNTKLGQFAYTVITPSKHLIESVNTSEKTISLKLPDESIVELGAGSRIAYANNFDSSQTRDVYLLGEALFTVTKNPAHPFRVFANFPDPLTVTQLSR